MKSKKTLIGIVIITVVIALIVLRLISNKRALDEKIKLVTEFNSTVPVQVDTVKMLDVKGGFSSNGNFEPCQETTITSQSQGKIVQILAKVGSKVSLGQALVCIDNKLVKSQLDLAKYSFEKSKTDLQRYEQLVKTEAVTIQQYEQAKQACINAQATYVLSKDQYENSVIKAPFSGVITKRNVEVGTFLQPGNPVFDIVSINKIKLIVKLTETEVSQVLKNEIVKVTTDLYPSTIFKGTVAGIVVKADGSKRYDVEIEVINQPDKVIKPGMFGTATFDKRGLKSALVIPRKALTGSIKEPQVFVLQGDSVLLKDIDVDFLNDKLLTVKGGLSEGEIIVMSGQINLESGSKVKVIH